MVVTAAQYHWTVQLKMVKMVHFTLWKLCHHKKIKQGHKNVYSNVHSGIIPNNQKAAETTQMPTNEWMEEQNVTKPHN